MDDFSLPIAQQPRLVRLVPFVFMAGAALSASVAFVIARGLGASQPASGLAAVCCLVAGIVLGIWTAAGPQGTIRFRAPDTLEVDARWRRPLRLSLGAVRARQFVWQRGRPSLLVGVYVELADTAGRISIGSSDIELAAVYQAARAEPTTVPPNLTLEPAEYRRLLELIPAGAITDGER
ncbi:MAG: hypothetical protein FIB01_15320 [Gemmatimonadetes bacterium]|nr:hypothetical protein [Gemmatimonadota bacterium]